MQMTNEYLRQIDQQCRIIEASGRPAPGHIVGLLRQAVDAAIERQARIKAIESNIPIHARIPDGVDELPYRLPPAPFMRLG